jgi:adenosylcobinamide kinase/adenosylcobinamide-phosphate guanylyltransferase
VVIIDCLTLLVSNCMGEVNSPEDLEGAEGRVDEELDGILAAYERSGARWILISNEVGLGVVPAYPLGRAYRDLLGRANQRMAEEADHVIFMLAGLPMTIK